MPSSTKSPGTLANDAAVGSVAWTDAGNAEASDNAYAGTGSGVNPSASSQYLKATNFGFAIPSGATILGIEVSVERKADSAGIISDLKARLVKGGTVQATDKAAAGTWGNSDATVTYGGSTDKWSGTWTAADINDADFGFVLQVQGTGSSTTPRVDHIQIAVTYRSGKANWKKRGFL